jgi:hypothetical protein
LWRHHLQIRPSPRAAVEDMAAVVTAVVASMVAAVVSTVAAVVTAVEVSTVVAEASTAGASVSEDFTAGHFMVGDFTVVLFMVVLFMPFALLRGRDAVTVRVAFKSTLKPTLPAPAMGMFLEVPSRAATPPQIERFSATPAR